MHLGKPCEPDCETCPRCNPDNQPRTVYSKRWNGKLFDWDEPARTLQASTACSLCKMKMSCACSTCLQQRAGVKVLPSRVCAHCICHLSLSLRTLRAPAYHCICARSRLCANQRRAKTAGLHPPSSTTRPRIASLCTARAIQGRSSHRGTDPRIPSATAAKNQARARAFVQGCGQHALCAVCPGRKQGHCPLHSPRPVSHKLPSCPDPTPRWSLVCRAPFCPAKRRGVRGPAGIERKLLRQAVPGSTLRSSREISPSSTSNIGSSPCRARIRAGHHEASEGLPGEGVVVKY